MDRYAYQGKIKRRHAGVNLQAAAAQYKKMLFILDHIAAYVAYVDAKSLRYEFVNHEFARLYRATREEIIGRRMCEVLPAKNYQNALPYIEAVQEGKIVAYEAYFEIPVGKKWISVEYIPETDAEGQVTAFVVLGTDISKRKIMEEKLEMAVRDLEMISAKDELTGLPNRRYFNMTLHSEYQRLSASKAVLSVIMMDIDYFKGFNDLYGHLLGDMCLRSVAKALADSLCQDIALAARYGGEEFVCILPEADLYTAGLIAERMRLAVENLHICHEASTVSSYVTISLGIASLQCTEGADILKVVDDADAALYMAKKKGRNRVEVF